MKKFKLIGLTAGAALLLNGCLLTSPHWNQEFDDHTDAIPMQAFTTNKSVPVKFQCAQAGHGGLYPSPATASWVHVATVNPQSQPLRDSNNGRIYGASKYKTLPSACWRQDPANSVWYAALRATQNTTVLGTDQEYFHTFTKSGLECLGRENGKAASWFAWFSQDCESGNQYTIFYATS